MNTHSANTCPAFFLDATINSAGAYSPCTALGGGALNFPNQSLREQWLSTTLQDLRVASASGQQLPMCKRCWSEEKLNFVSERQYLIKDLPENFNYTDPGYYESGPRHLNIKVSNICNLRCRTCQSRDSYLYKIEGDYYQQHYKQAVPNFYNMEKDKKQFTDQQLQELWEFSNNLERIELYGGEPFLDSQIPRYLIRLVESGRAAEIDLSVSTNATHELTDTWRTILTSFKNVILNISIDGIEQEFTYLRHPGRWHTVERNIQQFFELEHANTTITVQPVVTVSALNILSLPGVFEYFKQYNVEPFIILVQWPGYYCVNVLPESVRDEISARLASHCNPKFQPVIDLLNTPRFEPWERFKFWTQAKDQYRAENFATVFVELAELLKAHGYW